MLFRSPDLIRKYFKSYCEEVGIKMDQLIELGLSYPGRGHQPFSLTVLAIHLSTYCNGVSQLHGEVSNQMWGHLYKQEITSARKPITAITNGIHTQTWLGFHMGEMFDRYLTPAWRDKLLDDLFWKRGIGNIPDKELWDVHHLDRKSTRLNSSHSSVSRMPSSA